MTTLRAALWATTRAPWGPLLVAVHAAGIVAIELLTPEAVFVTALERRLGAPAERLRTSSPGDRRHVLLGRTMAALETLLDGRRPDADLPLDLAGRSAWDRAVLEGVGVLAWGEIASYGAVARRIGRAGAARAVGGAVGRNPIGLLVPCHRVVAADGSLGGYGGDWWGDRDQRLGIKRDLLALEGHAGPWAGR